MPPMKYAAIYYYYADRKHLDPKTVLFANASLPSCLLISRYAVRVHFAVA